MGLPRASREEHIAAQHCSGGAILPLTLGELLGPSNLKPCKIQLPGSICILQPVHTLQKELICHNPALPLSLSLSTSHILPILFSTAAVPYWTAGALVAPCSALGEQELLQLHAFVMSGGTSVGHRMHFPCKVSSGLRGNICWRQPSDLLQASHLPEKGSNAARGSRR